MVSRGDVWCGLVEPGKLGLCNDHHDRISLCVGQQDASVYELIHDMLNGTQRPEDIEPLKVVMDRRGLHIVRGHRRGLALCALQGMWRDRTVLAPCILYDAKHSEVAGPFARCKDTTVDGLAVKLHGTCPEAWHLGKPLFRTPQEWCDLRADTSMPDLCQSPEPLSGSAGQLSGMPGPCDESKEKCAESKLVCCLWLEGKCNRDGHHTLGKNLYLHEDVPGLQCGFGINCKYKHYEARNGSTAAGTELKEGMVVCVTKRNGSQVSGKVLEISQDANRDLAPVRLHYSDTDQASQMKKDWFPLHQMQLPDFSKIEPGTQGSGRNNRDCRVLQVSKAKDRACAPLHVRYTGSPSNQEWLGAETFRSKLLTFHDPTLPAKGIKGSVVTGETGLFSSDNSQTRNAATAEDVELKKGMVVCVNGAGAQLMSGKILDISRLPTRSSAPVKVRYTPTDEAGKFQDGWFPLQQLQVPDFSEIQPGMRVGVLEEGTNRNYTCQVLEVSDQKGKAQAPVYVHYHGYDSDDDEWVGADRLRSRSLVFRKPTLVSLLDEVKVTRPEPQQWQAKPLGCRTLEKVPVIPRAVPNEPEPVPTMPWCQAEDDDAHSPRSDRVGPREDSESDSDDSEPSIPPSDIKSSCVGAPNDWEDRMARQPLCLK